MKMTNNLDKKTVSGFGDEWERFDQSKLTDSQALNSFQNYFSIFPLILKNFLLYLYWLYALLLHPKKRNLCHPWNNRCTRIF